MFFRPNVAKMAGRHDVPGLIKVLSDHDPRLRVAASEALGDIGGVDAIASLLWTALTDPEETVCEAASRTFQRIAGLKDILEQGFLFVDGDDQTWVAHFHLHRHRPPRREWTAVRIETFLRLGGLGVAMLCEALSDRDWRLRESAAKALSSLESEPSDGATLAWYLVGLQEWGRLGALGADAVEPLVATLDHPSSLVRGNATKALVQIGLPAIPALSSAIFRSPSRSQKMAAVTAIEDIASSERRRGKPDPVEPQVRVAISRMRVEQLAALEQALSIEADLL